MTDVKQLITEHLDIWLTAETEKKSGRGRSSGSNDTIYGVQKLRELILKLAVRGNLNTYNSNDADILPLLKLKKEKYEIAQRKGWIKTTIGAVYSFVYGDNLPQPKRSNTGEYNVYGSNGIVGTHNEYCIDKPCIVVGRKGSAGALNICEEKSWVTDVAYACIPSDPINLKFSYYLLSTCGLDDLGKGIKPGLNRNDAYKVNILIPPLEEQQRIVEKVDELMQLCDQLEQQQTLSSDAHATLVDTLLKALTESNDADEFQDNWQRIVANFDVLFTTEYSIEQLKQTVLQLAVMGKLVKQDPSDEPASELLKKIADEKAKLIKEGKIKKSKPLPEIGEDEKPFALPSGWEYTHLESQVLDSGAGWSPSCDPQPRVGSDWGVLKVSAVSWDRFNPLENKSLPKHLEPRLDCEVQDGDFLISRANTADLVAKSVIAYDPPKNLMLSDKIVRLKLTNYCSKEYINLCNKTKFTRNYYATVSGGTSDSMRNVSRQQILALVIPLPPINEQKRIVQKVNQLFSMIEQLQVLQSKLQKTKLHLADALVANAVEGV